MTYDQFKDCLRLANLSVRDLAVILDMKPNSITNYRAKGVVPRHLAVIATLLATLVAYDLDAVEVLGSAR